MYKYTSVNNYNNIINDHNYKNKTIHFTGTFTISITIIIIIIKSSRCEMIYMHWCSIIHNIIVHSNI